MSDAILPTLGIVAYLALFATVGILFLLVNLVVGKFVRPRDPHDEKLEIYECGEPAVGSSFVQFDIRFYVVALLFIIFDVEVAFFFPWATVFGKATHLAELAERAPVVATAESEPHVGAVKGIYRELGVQRPQIPVVVPPSLADKISASTPAAQRSTDIVREGSRQLALVALVDIAVFFAILLIGFAYVWKRGDLNWVRAYRGEPEHEGHDAAPPTSPDLDQALSA